MSQETTTFEITLRRALPTDAQKVAQIAYEAFKGVAEQRGFEPDFPSVDIALSMATIFLNHPGFFGIAAEIDGELVGSNFLDERSEIRGVGPITVDAKMQNKGVGRVLMQAVLDRAKDAKSVRLVQDAANPVSLSLYSKLGFAVREPLFLLYGRLKGEAPEAYTVRPMRQEDLKACNDLCFKAHGFDRNGELVDAMSHFGSLVAIRRGRIVAYATAPTLWVMNHGVAETDKDLKALLLHACSMKDAAVSLLIPGRQNDLLEWAIAEGLRVAKPMTLMSKGFYQTPETPWFPSVAF